MRKTVSVLLLIFLTLAVALFSFTSCKNEPEPQPTAAPKPGEIPSIPNNLTTINSLSEEQTTALSTLFGDVGRFFVNYLDTYGYDDNDGPLYDLMNDPQFSFGDATATLSAAASSGTFGTGNDAKSYAHEAITGYLGINDADNICLCADTVVTTELFGWTAGTKIHVEYDMIKDHVDIFIGEKENYNTFDIRCDDLDGSGYSLYRDGQEGTVSSTDKPELENKVNFLMFIATRALKDATISFSNVTLSDTIEGDTVGDNKAIFTINGQVQFDGKYMVDSNNKEVTTFTAFSDELSKIYSSLSVSVESLKVQAVVTTKVTTSEGDKSELLAATLDVTNLSFLMDYDNTNISLECDKLALSLSDSKESVLLSLELSDIDFDLTSVESNARAIRTLSASISSTVGLGIKAGENSIGLVTDLEIRSSGLIPFITVEPKAAVINGSFYSTKEIKNILIDYLDMFISMVIPTAS